MIVMDATHPLWPVFRSVQNAHGRPDVVELPYQEWLTWHYHCRLKGVGFVALTAEEAALLLGPPAEAA